MQQPYNKTIASIVLPDEIVHCFKNGDKLQIDFKNGDYVYTVKTKVIEQETNTPVRILMMVPQNNKNENVPDGKNRRRNVRQPVLLPAKYELIGIKDNIYTKELKKATILDISVGGVRIATKDRLQKDSRINLKFTLRIDSQPRYFDFIGRVVYSRQPKPQEEIYHSGIQFLNTTLALEDLIQKFIFQEMSRTKNIIKG